MAISLSQPVILTFVTKKNQLRQEVFIEMRNFRGRLALSLFAYVEVKVVRENHGREILSQGSQQAERVRSGS